MIAKDLALVQIYWQDYTPRAGNLSFYVIVGLVALVLGYWLIKRLMAGPGGGKSRSASSTGGGSGGFKKNSFRRMARSAGLDENETALLEKYGRVVDLSEPGFLFRNPDRIDAFFKSAYRAIESGSAADAETERRKAALFSAREKLDRRNAQGGGLSSTRQLGPGTALSFITPAQESYPSVIVAVEPGGLAVDPARDPYNKEIRLRRGTRLSCFFYAKEHQGYQFATRVAGWTRMGGEERMILAHSDAVSALPARLHTRRSMRAPCSFYRIAVPKSGGKARVENLPFPGTITDVSAGGIGIQCASPLQPEEFVKIDFNPGGGTRSVFAKVKRMSRLGATGGVMHLQFVKISRETLNAILAYVYGYGA